MRRSTIHRYLNLYDKIKKEAPEFPDYTCPYIDDVIKSLEEIRAQNDALRDCAKHWKDQTKLLCEEVYELNRLLSEYEQEDN
jgi:hypothetical protein